MSDASESTVGQTADAVPPRPPRQRKLSDAWRELKKAPLSAKFGLLVISVYVFVALLPAGAIALLTVGVNFVVDWFLHKTSGLRDEQ